MPTREAVTNTIVPQKEIAPIPERVVITRSTPRPQNPHQPTTTKEPAAADPATPEESVKLSPQLSAIARKEQAFRQREAVLKQREKDLEAKLAKADQFDQISTKFAAKDYSEAEKMGLSYEEYTKYRLDKMSSEDPQTQALKKLEAEIQAIKTQQEESVSQSFDETVSEYKKEIAKAIAEDPEFSSVKELKREDAVLQLILDTWEEDQVELSVKDACKDIEEFLVEQGKRFSALPKLKTAPAVDERKLPPPKPTVRTLTNSMQPSGEEKKPVVSLQSLSEAERYAEARRRALAKRQQQGA